MDVFVLFLIGQLGGQHLGSDVPLLEGSLLKFIVSEDSPKFWAQLPKIWEAAKGPFGFPFLVYFWSPPKGPHYPWPLICMARVERETSKVTLKGQRVSVQKR